MSDKSTGGKDLQDLQGLARSPLESFAKKAAQPTAPRDGRPEPPGPRYPLLAAFSADSWRWFLEYVGARFGPRHALPDYSQTGANTGVYRMEDDDGEIRIALASDWGTGTDEAAHVAGRIVDFDAHYTIHLGDIYYVGTAAETGENFLGLPGRRDFTPTKWPHGSRGAFALLGNHEMYARGFAYFDLMLPGLGPVVDGQALKQITSFFCLENDHWRIVGLDTGYNSVGVPLLEYLVKPDCALPAALLQWLRTAVKPRADDPRGIILLSHHQYFSSFDGWHTRAAIQLSEFFARPVLWFWGHEHRLAIYDEFAAPGGIRAQGRCIGHGGMPIERDPGPVVHEDCPLLFTDMRHYPNDEDLDVGFNGCARLTLRAAELHVDYVDLAGHVVYAEDWRVEAGRLAPVVGVPVA